MIIETKRLLIHPLTINDTHALYQLQREEGVLEFNVMAPKSIDEMTLWIEKHLDGEKDLAIEEKATHQLIGMIHLEEDDLRYQANSKCISYYLSSNKVGKGYMMESLPSVLNDCFYRRKLSLISARVFVPNTRSNQLMKRLGFIQEGTLKAAVKGYIGTIFDDNLYRMTKEEFDKRYPEFIK